MSDLIDREQAKDAIDKYLVGRNLVTDGTFMARLINEIVIDRLPSAQPTFDARDTQYNLPIGTDCISRQSAIDAIDEYMVGKNCATDGTMMARLINELVIKRLPSATDKNVGTKLGIDPYKIERAIRGLTEWQKHVQTESDIDRDISVAVEALKAQLGTDCISRQAAIDALNEVVKDHSITDFDAIASILDLPPAQPDIVRCKDCKHHWTHKCMDSMPIERCDLEQTFYDAEIDYCSLAERREDG